MPNIQTIISWFGTNEFILGIATLAGLLGFVLTLSVAIRTSKISRILRRNTLIQDYNKNRNTYAKVFTGHRDSILRDGLRTDLLWNDILKTVVEYKAKYSKLPSTGERINLWRLYNLLNKKCTDTNFLKVAKKLSILAGYLQKKEVEYHG